MYHQVAARKELNQGSIPVPPTKLSFPSLNQGHLLWSSIPQGKVWWGPPPGQAAERLAPHHSGPRGSWTPQRTHCGTAESQDQTLLASLQSPAQGSQPPLLSVMPPGSEYTATARGREGALGSRAAKAGGPSGYVILHDSSCCLDG